MFRSRWKLQPKILRTAPELCLMLPTTGFANNLKADATQKNGIGVFSSQTKLKVLRQTSLRNNSMVHFIMYQINFISYESYFLYG